MTDRAAYYDCGGAYNLDEDEHPPETCPSEGCDADLKQVVEFHD